MNANTSETKTVGVNSIKCTKTLMKDRAEVEKILQEKTETLVGGKTIGPLYEAGLVSGVELGIKMTLDLIYGNVENSLINALYKTLLWTKNYKK